MRWGKTWIGLALFHLFCLNGSRASSQIESAPVKVDLSAAQRYAVEHNYGVMALRYESEQMQSRYRSARAPFFPKLGVAGGGESDSNADSSEGAALGFVYASYNLFNGFRDSRKRDVSFVEKEQGELRLRDAELKVELEVEEFFHLYLYKKALIELKDQELALNETHRKLVDFTRQRGSVSETDVMEFQLKDAMLKSQLIALKQEMEDARSNLKRLLGEEIGGNIQPVGSLQHQHVKIDLMALLSKIEQSSAIVKEKALTVQISHLEQRATDGKWWPTADIEARAGYLPMRDRLDKNKSQASVLLTAKWDLYTGGEVREEARDRALAVLKAESELKDVINQSIRRVEVAFRNLKVTEARADLEKDNSTFAKKYYDSVVSEYKRGFKNSYDLSTAADRLSETTIRKIDLDYEFLKQRIEVERALGARVDVEIIR